MATYFDTAFAYLFFSHLSDLEVSMQFQLLRAYRISIQLVPNRKRKCRALHDDEDMSKE
jgi:hypothetical protein